MSEFTEFGSFRSIIELWATREAMGAETGAGAPRVTKWWQRDKIPSEWWSAVLGTERARTAGVTAERMTTLASRIEAEVRV